jgi:type VI secretion system protein ImpE
MTPHAALADGRLADAVALQSAIVADGPDDPAARLFLVELLAVAGRFREAWDHLRRITSDDPGWPASRRRFARLVRAAARREAGRRPTFLADPPPHAARRRRALRAEPAAAVRLIDRADAATPHLFGHVDGREFDGLRDADDRFASVLEAVVGREYVWVPWEHLRRITLAPVEHILDRAFRPARLRLADYSEVPAHLPMVYPGSAGDDAFALGLDTDHPDPAGGPVRCVGGKLLLLRDEELPLAEVRQIDVVGWA